MKEIRFRHSNGIGITARRFLWKKYGGRCAYCKRIVLPRDNRTESGADTKRDYAIDHMTPKSRGGSDNIRNLALACRNCNAKKKNKTRSEFLAWLIDEPKREMKRARRLRAVKKMLRV